MNSTGERYDRETQCLTEGNQGCRAVVAAYRRGYSDAIAMAKSKSVAISLCVLRADSAAHVIDWSSVDAQAAKKTGGCR